MPSRPSHVINHEKPNLISNSTNKYFLNFQSVKELPDSFAWAPHGDPCSIESDVFKPDSVPIVDLEDLKAHQLIGLACKSWGVFQIINHGIPKRLLDDIEIATKSLFGLSVHQKLKAARSSDGITGYGPARISSFFSKRMWSEGFTILGSPLDHARQLWPNDYTKFCDIIDEYQKEMNQLAKKLMQLILASLGIPNQDILKWADLLQNANGAIQLNSYPVCPDPNRAMGLAAHTDSTLLTILHQSSTTGLQVFKDRTGWVTVPPLSGGLVINIGDLLHILSNGQYPSVYHRAMVNRVQQRYSMAYLYGPGSGVRIQPLPKLIDATHPPLYRPVTWSEYLGIKGEHFNKALSLIRLKNNINPQIKSLITSDHEPKTIKVDSDKTILAGFA
ncbi:gibberellin 3-beta-dioxygenase 2-like [Amaranthus tricolor]|uniref:gibberellin 3-beta-dioxygenase 2-like n=1 Tax=Amaranthus tricolor TaxID=29722 RepID=UPI00258C02CE|nr:gibberellin 3-beta-dioxygenase 2-like [Amaranthus tricolor]